MYNTSLSKKVLKRNIQIYTFIVNEVYCTNLWFIRCDCKKVTDVWGEMKITSPEPNSNIKVNKKNSAARYKCNVFCQNITIERVA